MDKQIEKLLGLCRAIAIAQGGLRGDMIIHAAPGAGQIYSVHFCALNSEGRLDMCDGAGDTIQEALDEAGAKLVQVSRLVLAEHEGHRDVVAKALRAAIGE